MFWVACVALGVSIFLYTRREQVKQALLLAHYEAIYWLIGGVALVEDVVQAPSNKLGDLPKRRGDVAVVTGGARGIGLEIVRKLLECDMHVVIGCRRVEAGRKAVDELRGQGVTTGTVTVLELDTSSTRLVRQFAADVLSNVSQLNVLVNNAGIMFVPHKLTEDGFESHLAVNYIGHALLTHLLLPLMKETGAASSHVSRIVHVSSCAYLAGSINYEDMHFSRSSYVASKAYAQSKLAQILFSNSLNRHLQETKARVTSVAVHPGVVNTELFDGTFLKTIAPWMPGLVFKTPEQGSRSIVFSALSQSMENVGGVYVSNCRQPRLNTTASDVAQQDRMLVETMKMLKLTEFCGVRA